MCNNTPPPYPSNTERLVLTPAEFEACEQLRKGLRSVKEVAKALGIDKGAAWERFAGIRKKYQITQDELLSRVYYFPPINKKNLRVVRSRSYRTASGRFAARAYDKKLGDYRHIGSYLTREDADFASNEVEAGRPAPVPPHKADDRERKIGIDIYYRKGRFVLRSRQYKRKRRYIANFDTKEEAEAAADRIRAGLPVDRPPRKPKKLEPSVYEYKETGKFAVAIWVRSEKRRKYIGYFDDREEGYRAGLAALEQYNGKESIKQVAHAR